MTIFNTKYQNKDGRILRVIKFHDNPKNPYRYRIQDENWDAVGEDRNLTAAQVLEMIPDDYKPVGGWVDDEVTI